MDRNLASYSPWSRKESDTTKRLTLSLLLGHSWPDFQALKNFRTKCLSYLKCCLTCCAGRQAQNLGSVQIGQKKGQGPALLLLKPDQDFLCFNFPNTDKNYKKENSGNSLAVQWLGRCASTAGDIGSIPGRVTRSHMPLCTAKSKNSE